MSDSEERIPEQAREAEPGNVPDAGEPLSDEERATRSQMPEEADDLPAGDADREGAAEGEPGDNDLGLGSSDSSPREPQGGL